MSYVDLHEPLALTENEGNYFNRYVYDARITCADLVANEVRSAIVCRVHRG